MLWINHLMHLIDRTNFVISLSGFFIRTIPTSGKAYWGGTSFFAFLPFICNINIKILTKRPYLTLLGKTCGTKETLIKNIIESTLKCQNILYVGYFCGPDATAKNSWIDPESELGWGSDLPIICVSWGMNRGFLPSRISVFCPGVAEKGLLNLSEIGKFFTTHFNGSWWKLFLNTDIKSENRYVRNIVWIA